MLLLPDLGIAVMASFGGGMGDVMQDQLAGCCFSRTSPYAGWAV